MVYLATFGVVATTDLLIQVARLQQEQVLQMVDTVYEDGLHMGCAYAYQIGKRDTLTRVNQEVVPLHHHAAYHAGQQQVTVLQDLKTKYQVTEKCCVGELAGMESLQGVNVDFNQRLTTSQTASQASEAALNRTEREQRTLHLDA